jgi:hypothetical protein
MDHQETVPVSLIVTIESALSTVSGGVALSD